MPAVRTPEPILQQYNSYVPTDARSTDTTRRRILFGVPAAILGGGVILWRFSDGPAAQPKLVTIVEFDDGGGGQRTSQRLQVARPDSDWRSQLTAQQYWSARRGTTDTPFSGTLYRSHAPGLARCVCCGNALFHSRDQFDSGTGWPAYSAPVAQENIWTREDSSLGLRHTEVLCRLCDAHLGHVFDDGPPPQGLRYCINESALRLVRG